MGHVNIVSQLMHHGASPNTTNVVSTLLTKYVQLCAFKKQAKIALNLLIFCCKYISHHLRTEFENICGFL